MAATWLVLTALLAADAQTPSISLYTPSPALAAAVRGQAPYDEDPLGAQGPQTYAAPGAVPPAGAPPVYGAPAYPGYGDPFMGAPADPGYLYGDPSLAFGAVGPQPYRMGWSSRYDFAFLPEESAEGGRGDFQVTEFNMALRNTTGWPYEMPLWMFSWTPEFNARWWEGPNTPDLPGQVFRFASDFELATPGNQPWSVQLGFTPALVSDLQQSLNSDGYNWDGRGVLFFRPSQELMLAFGTMYLDRVKDRFIPYAGFVWTPDDRWEFRIMYPKTRISYFVGNCGGIATWLYAGLEYNIEAYQIDLAGPGGANEKIQIEDYRATLGIRTDNGFVSSFVEGGWVFARDVEFLHGTPGFDIQDGFLVRAGVRF